jgi:hypothetical protein
LYLNDPEGYLLARRKERAKDLKKQRWAGIIAAVLALGMIGSLVIGYIGQAVGGGGAQIPQEQAEPQPEDYLDHYRGEVEKLEDYIEEHGASEAVLLELAENYRYLVFIQQLFFEDQEALEEYQGSLTAVYSELVDLEPSNEEYRLELINLYMEQQLEEDQLTEEIASLQEILREDPSPLVHLSLISLLSSYNREELFEEESQWLYQYLNEKIEDDVAGGEEVFYFAVLLGEYLDSPSEAKTVLSDLLEVEDEESQVYQEAQNYLTYLQTDNDEEEMLP